MSASTYTTYGFWSYDEGYVCHKSQAEQFVVIYEDEHDSRVNTPNRSWMIVWL